MQRAFGESHLDHDDHDTIYICAHLAVRFAEMTAESADPAYFLTNRDRFSDFPLSLSLSLSLPLFFFSPSLA